MSGDLVCRLSGTHFIVDDGCKVSLESSTVLDNVKAKRGHSEALGLADLYPTRKTHLLFLNTRLAENVFVKNESIQLRCPECNTVYTVTREMYHGQMPD